MFLPEVFFAFIIALLVAIVLMAVLGWRYPGVEGMWPGVLFLFLLVFFVTWAIGAWVEPVGPVVWGGYWLPYVVIGLFFLLLLLALVPFGTTGGPREPTVEPVPAPEEQRPSTAVGVFFWILLIGLAVAIIFAYAW